MSIVSEFKNAAVGRVSAAVVGLVVFLMGAGGYAYSAFYAHGTPSEDGMRRPKRVNYLYLYRNFL